MSLAEAFETGAKRSQKGHFRNLVMIARADGSVDTNEEAVLMRIARGLGLTEVQVEEIRKDPKKYPMIPPVDNEERVSRLVDLVEMVQADGEIDEHELNVLYRYAAGLGFTDEKTAMVVNTVFNGLRDGRDRGELKEELSS